MPGLLAAVKQNPDAAPKKASSLWEGAKHLLSKAWDNRDLIASAA